MALKRERTRQVNFRLPVHLIEELGLTADVLGIHRSQIVRCSLEKFFQHLSMEKKRLIGQTRRIRAARKKSPPVTGDD